ncbi:MAG: hypothetical protein ACRDF7_09735 [Candidatus Limnocylindrales bacterium]
MSGPAFVDATTLKWRIDPGRAAPKVVYDMDSFALGRWSRAMGGQVPTQPTLPESRKKRTGRSELAADCAVTTVFEATVGMTQFGLPLEGTQNATGAQPVHCMACPSMSTRTLVATPLTGVITPVQVTVADALAGFGLAEIDIFTSGFAAATRLGAHVITIRITAKAGSTGQ